MKLRVLHRYESAAESYEKRQVIDVDDEHGCWLLDAAPGCFAVMDEPEPEKEQESLDDQDETSS